ncbi:MAG: transposase [Acidobacteriaceae bacterium]
MVHGAGAGRHVRRWRTVSEKRRIAELTCVPGASVALVAREHGVNANQVFKWRRALKKGELVEPAAASTALLGEFSATLHTGLFLLGRSCKDAAY